MDITPDRDKNFLFDCERFFIGMSVPQDKRVFFASCLLDRPVKTWWRHTCTVRRAAGTLTLSLTELHSMHSFLLASMLSMPLAMLEIS
jgi:hypothetical protein